MSHYKRCNSCRTVKPAEEFKTGDFICKDCQAKIKKNKEGKK